MSRVEYTLLENGLDFIWSALDRLSFNPDPGHLKYAILHLSSGVELILKERLRREHWSLIFEKPENANRIKYEAGDFSSASFQGCLKRLEDICSLKISEEQRKRLISLRDRRNRLEHFGIVDTVEAFTADAVGALGFVIDFVNSQLADELEESEADTLEKIRRKLGDFQAFVKERMAELKAEISNADGVIKNCPSCKQRALAVFRGARCCFCHYSGAAEDAAAAYRNALGDDSERLYNCVACGGDAVVWEGEQPDSEYVCFDCGRTWPSGQLTECYDCGNLFAGPGYTCDDCTAEWEEKENE